VTAPVQPTPEALAEAKDMLRNFSHDWDMSAGIKAVAARIDRFAAQRVADLQNQLERMRQRYHAAIEEGMAAETPAAPPPGDERYRQLGIDPANPNPDGSDFHLMNIVDSAPPPGDAGERARKIAAEIDVEHDETPQADCKVCQRVIPFITAALQSYGTAAASQARRETIEECARVVENRKFNEFTSVIQNIRALATPQESEK
jgi:hypothetical protein